MTIYYFLTHVEISMIIFGLIGFFGNKIEPGPIPQLMMAVSGIYLTAYYLARGLFSYWKYERGVMNGAYRELTWENPDYPRRDVRSFKMYDLKEAK